MLSRRSKAYRAAEQRMDYYAVCLVGWTRPRPGDFGDNEGIWPVKIVIRKKELEAAKEWDQESPHAEVEVLESVLVESMAHATRLKDALNEVLLGQQEDAGNKGLRRNFRNVVGCWEVHDEVGRGLFWSVLLTEAQQILSKTATSFDVFDADEAYRRISGRAMKGK
jgi:hypothetical protein